MARDDWFTIEQIDQSTYAISEYGHWENTHSYLLLGTERAILIDTGMGIGNIRSVTDHLTALPIHVITTHVHNDHIGGHGLFTSIAVHAAEAGWLERGVPLSPDRVRAWLLKEPFSRPAPASFDPDTYTPFRGKASDLLLGGEIIDLGDRSLVVIHTPGHSPGHICLYEEAHGYLFTGDLIYQGKLDAYYPSTDPVLFAESVEKLTHLPSIKRILPGHYSLDLADDLLVRINDALGDLAKADLLRHATGVHSFGDFQIHL